MSRVEVDDQPTGETTEDELDGTAAPAALEDPADEKAALTRAAWGSVTELFFGQEMHDRFHRAAEQAGVPHPGALKALMGLDADLPRSMRSLADEMRCDASYITNLVDSLEERGYVERRTSPVDRRVKLVHLTEGGRQAQDAARAVITTPPTALDRLTLAEARTLARLLAKVV
jgi:DNA-binding MarR family transcriptional regulator